jgi:hypothetical protein
MQRMHNQFGFPPRAPLVAPRAPLTMVDYAQRLAPTMRAAAAQWRSDHPTPAASLDQLRTYARTSPRIVELEARAEREVQTAIHRGLHVEIGTTPGRTATNPAEGLIEIEPGLSPREFALRYAHELSNVTQMREFQGVSAQARAGQLRDGNAYADAIIGREANGIIEQAVVAAQLQIPHRYAARAQDYLAGRITRSQFYDIVQANIEQAQIATGNGRSVPARRAYVEQFERLYGRPSSPTFTTSMAEYARNLTPTIMNAANTWAMQHPPTMVNYARNLTPTIMNAANTWAMQRPSMVDYARNLTPAITAAANQWARQH